MTDTIQRPADRSAWLNLRHGFGNASDAAVYMDCHPYKTKADLAVEKLAAEPVEIESRAMTRGNKLEAAVADWWADEHGVRIWEPDVLYRAGRLLATLDRRIYGADRDGLEVKTTKHVVSEPMTYWWWQAQAQMVCADLDRVHFAVLDGTMDLRSFTVDRDDDACTSLLAAVDAFWSFIDLGMVPEGVELLTEHVQTMYPQHAERYVDLDDDGLQAVVLLHESRAARLEAEKAEDAAKDAVARILLDCEEARYDGRPVVTWRSTKPTDRTDWKAVAAEAPELVAKHTAPQPGARRMVVKV